MVFSQVGDHGRSACGVDGLDRGVGVDRLADGIVRGLFPDVVIHGHIDGIHNSQMDHVARDVDPVVVAGRAQAVGKTAESIHGHAALSYGGRGHFVHHGLVVKDF